jgi:Fe-S oxidoreductase
MCNNNGACRKHQGGAMCPSYRATMNERDVTRGRANTLRLALSGQLGPDALTSDEMFETLKLCVSCKACRRECPTGVDMAKMKIEVMAARAERRGLTLRDKMIAWLPHYGAMASRIAGLLNLRNRAPALAAMMETVVGFSARRKLPEWRRDYFRQTGAVGPADGREVVLFADTFNRYFEAENLQAAVRVLSGAGYRVHLPKAADGKRRPLCCGRTFLTAGLVRQARSEASRTLNTLLPYVRRGVPVIGLEPSCIFTFRDEFISLSGRKSPDAAHLSREDCQALAGKSLMFEEFLAGEIDAGRFKPALAALGSRALLHGHCHQKAFDAVAPVTKVLAAIPGLKIETIDSSCCGMAGAFGYQSETYDVSIAMAERSLLPAIRKAPDDVLIVADGTSCRHQIRDGSGRSASHVAAVLAMSMERARTAPTTSNAQSIPETV